MIGIDLGTTNSLIACLQKGRPVLIPNSLGAFLTPSCVSVTDEDEFIVGAAARERLIVHPERTVAMFKRYMGTHREFVIGGHRLRSEELSALVLKSLAADAAAFLGTPVESVVITVPAYFNDKQRKATRAAGELAGLRVERLLNEPTAAALSFQLHQAEPESRFVVCDLGGGTFDVSILELFEGLVEVRASTGDNFLGGEDFSDALVEAFMAAAGNKAGIVPGNPHSDMYQTLRRQADLAKLALSDASSAQMQVLWRGETVSWTVTQEAFEAHCAPLLQRIRQPLVRALRDSGLDTSAINEVVLAGGATRMPMVRNTISRMFGRIARASRNPDHVIAEGAAIMAGLQADDVSLREVVMTDVCPYTLGTEVSVDQGNGQFEPGVYAPIIDRNTVVPTSRAQRFQTVRDNQPEVRFKIYQGENRRVENNILLGELTIPVPPRKGGEVELECRFTYDIDGLLEVDAEVVGTSTKRHVTIISQDSGLSPQEIELRRARLQTLKIHPRDEAENITAMSRAERLYEECIGGLRELVGRAISNFAKELAHQDPARIQDARQALANLLDQIEASTAFQGEE